MAEETIVDHKTLSPLVEESTGGGFFVLLDPRDFHYIGNLLQFL